MAKKKYSGKPKRRENDKDRIKADRRTNGSKGGSNRPQGNKDRFDERDEHYNAHKSRPNDIAWYAQNDQLLRDTASLPYSWPLGMQLDLGPYASEINKGSLPGIFAIHTAPTFGYSDNPNSPINVAARNVYSFVRHANAGHANYDAVDEMIYLMAMDSCYSFLSFVRRIYGVVQTYSYTNRYYATAVLRAMGVDYYSIQENLADFRAWINSIAVKFGSMCIPASMSYMAKHMWMYEGLYLDTPQNKSQTYLFVPDGFFKFSIDDDGAGCLVYDRLQKMDTSYVATAIVERDDPTLLTFEDLRVYGNELIDPILRSEDMNIMSGDILKAFGQGNLYMLDSISETYTVLPVYEPEVLDQIQNLTMIGRFTNDYAELVQDASKGWLQFTPSFRFPYQFESVKEQSAGENFLFASKFLTFDEGPIEPGRTMESSRMTQVCHDHDESSLTWNYHTLASEVAMYGYIYYFAMDSENVWKLWRSRTIHSANTAIVDPSASHSQFNLEVVLQDVGYLKEPDTATVTLEIPQINPLTVINAFNPMLLLAQQISQFNRHPAMALTLGITTGGASLTQKIEILESDAIAGKESIESIETVTTPAGEATPIWGKWYGLLQDINYYTIVDEKNLMNLSQTALLSMLNVTQFGRKAE